MGLDWSVIAVRLEQAPAATRAIVLDLLEGVEGGALKAAHAQAEADRESRAHG